MRSSRSSGCDRKRNGKKANRLDKLEDLARFGAVFLPRAALVKEDDPYF